MANIVEKKNMVMYLAEARSWENDKLQALENSLRTAWIIAVVSAVLAGISVFTVSALTPIQKVEAYVVRVNDTTGEASVLKPLVSNKVTYDEAVNRYFAQTYVRYREGYLPTLAAEYYYNVGLMSSSTEQSRYLVEFGPKNPKSPLNVYGSDARSVITIKSTTFPRPDLALIRYTRELSDATKREVTEWTATVHFMFSSAPMSDKDRAVNPLGFLVLNYAKSQDPVEVLPPASASVNNAEVDSASQVALPVTSKSAAPAAIKAVPMVPAIKSVP